MCCALLLYIIIRKKIINFVKFLCSTFRCVKQEDKSLSLGFSEIVMALVAFMPGPVLYGTILGKYLHLL